MTRIAAVLAFLASIGWVTRVGFQAPLFAHASPIVVGSGSGQVVLADFNRDGHLDMVTRHLLQRRLAVLLGNGKGAFAPAVGSPVALEYQPGRMAHADVNRDGVLDLAVTSRDGSGENINILLGDGRGEFGRAVGSPFTASASIELYKPDLQFADVNGDGKLDILTANGRRNTIEVLVGDGQGGFSRGSGVRLESGRDLYSFATGDVDGDEHVDVVTASSTEAGGPGRVALFRGDGKGGFAERVESSLSVPPSPRMGMVADVNGDKRPDITLAFRTRIPTSLRPPSDA